ncbi:tetratricopeptide repeat protein [Vibrio cyclitrophicus]|uniref:tetratricopeptide repeat protein n=1 Tax=Vibrio cyclitrophicus TaxID=47951 RepID=UPI000C84D828|nr:tetratricopeptide repeat protein [Vibrio cyclitrophicus]PMG83926.1 hypothetical protein BCU82_21050 [Vibrio cyclitrophicus]
MQLINDLYVSALEWYQQLGTAEVIGLWGTIATMLGVLFSILTFNNNDNSKTTNVNGFTYNDIDALINNIIKEKNDEISNLRSGHEFLREQLSTTIKTLMEISNDNEEESILKRQINHSLKLSKKGKIEEAEIMFENIACRLLKKHEVNKKMAAAVFNYQGSISYIHDFDKSLSSYKKATQVDPQNINAWKMLGRLYDRAGDYEKSINANKALLKLSKDKNNVEGIASAYCNAGITFMSLCDYDNSEKYLKNAIITCKKYNLVRILAFSNGNLGNVYKFKGKIEAAEEQYKKALDLNNSLDQKGGASSQYANIGTLYYLRGDIEEAINLYEKSISLELELDKPENLAHKYGYLGCLYRDCGNLNAAKINILKALDINSKYNKPYVEAKCLGALGTVLYNTEDGHKAEGYIIKAISICHKYNLKECMSAQYRNLAKFYLLICEHNKAKDAITKAIDINLKIGLIYELAFDYDLLGDILSGSNRYKESKVAYNNAISYMDKFGANKRVNELYDKINEKSDISV